MFEGSAEQFGQEMRDMFGVDAIRSVEAAQFEAAVEDRLVQTFVRAFAAYPEVAQPLIREGVKDEIEPHLVGHYGIKPELTDRVFSEAERRAKERIEQKNQ